jgi:hypothetical protein
MAETVSLKTVFIRAERASYQNNLCTVGHLTKITGIYFCRDSWLAGSFFYGREGQLSDSIYNGQDNQLTGRPVPESLVLPGNVILL